MRKFITFVLLNLICSVCFSQTYDIDKKIVNNKVKITVEQTITTTKTIEQDFELEPDTLRHIGRYVRVDTVDNGFEQGIEVVYRIVEGKIPYQDNSQERYGFTEDEFNYNFYNPEYEPIPVYKNGKYGYINLDGVITIPLKFDKADNFFKEKDGNLYAIVNKNGKYGVIDAKGNTIVDFIYKEFIYFDNEKEVQTTKSSGHPVNKLVADYTGELVQNRIYLVYDDKNRYEFEFENGKFIQKN